MTCGEYAAAAKARAEHGGAVISAQRYSKLFRTGEWPGPGTVESFVAPVNRTHTSESDEGTVLKFTQVVNAAQDGRPALEVESVLIPMIGKKRTRSYTLCVSSQVGCAMGCGFCQTAQMGLIRSLTAAEIVEQWFAATHLLGHTVRNMVFMGMGEPLDNYDNLMQAISVLIDHNGAAFPASKITVSTVGRLDGLAKMKAKLNSPGWHRLNLAVSLNAPNDEIRSKIMPINRSMPMAALRDMLTTWPIYGGGKICMEYVLIPGVNDAREHAAQLATFIAPIDAYYATQTNAKTPRVILNLIPYNPRRNSPWPAPAEEKVDEFLGWLRAEGLYAKRRRTKGRAMMGACGQLGSESIRKRRLVEVETDGGSLIQ